MTLEQLGKFFSSPYINLHVRGYIDKYHLIHNNSVPSSKCQKLTLNLQCTHYVLKDLPCVVVRIYRHSLALYSEMYLAAGEFIKAIEIMGQNGWVERYVLSTICVC